jgi:hypothetical protein
LPDRSKESTQTKIKWSSRLGVGSMGQHPITRKKNTHAKKPREKLEKTDGLSNTLNIVFNKF